MNLNIGSYVSKAFGLIFSDSIIVEENNEESIYKILVDAKKVILPITYIEEKGILITENKLMGKIVKLKNNKLSQDQATELLSIIENIYSQNIFQGTFYIQISRLIKEEEETYLSILQPFESIEKIIDEKKENLPINLLDEIIKQIGDEITKDLEVAKIISKYADLPLVDKEDHIEIKDLLGSSIIAEDLFSLYTKNRVYKNYAPVESFKYTENPFNPNAINEIILETAKENSTDIKIHNNIITQFKRGKIKSLITLTVGSENHEKMDKLNEVVIQASRTLKFPLFKYTQQIGMFTETIPANFFEEAFESHSNKKRIIKENKKTIIKKLSNF